jgi:DNA-binding PadR family transcriptional regulator
MFNVYEDCFKSHTSRHHHHDRSRRERHGFRHGRFGFMGGRGGDDLPGGRKIGSSDLQLLILALLAERPAHGYELIKTIDERSGGFYTPSPGMIYPALTFLDEIGHASVQQEGTRKLYSITAEGQAHLAANQETASAILEAFSRIGGRMDQVREAFAGVGDIDDGASDEVHRARHALKAALRAKRGSDPKEARRIAEILNRAAADISGQPPNRK